MGPSLLPLALVAVQEKFAETVHARITDKDQFTFYRNELFDASVQEQMKKLSEEMKAKIKNPNGKQTMKTSALQKQTQSLKPGEKIHFDMSKHECWTRNAMLAFKV